MTNYDEIDNLADQVSQQLDWETPIEDTGDELKPVPPGRYPFRVVKAVRSIWDHGKNQGCKYMDITLKVTLPDGGEGIVSDKLTLARNLLFRIRQFWKAVGADIQPGQAFIPDWDAIVGQEGMVEVEAREFTGKDGSQRSAPSVKTYLEKSAKPAAKLMSF